MQQNCKKKKVNERKTDGQKENNLGLQQCPTLLSTEKRGN